MLHGTSQPGMTTAHLSTTLGLLSRWPHEATGRSAVLLIDAYEAPLHAAFEYGYWDEAVTFFRSFCRRVNKTSMACSEACSPASRK